VASDGSDLGWLGAERRRPGHWTFTVTDPLSRLDGKFYGGTGIAAVTACMEAETGRRALWASVQFAASADVGARMDCEVEVLAGGRRTSQLRVTGSVGDRLVFAAIGATGESRPGPLNAQFGDRPDVAGPEDSSEWGGPIRARSPGQEPGWLAITDIRQAGPTALWMRMRDQPLTRAVMAFLADVIPNGVVRSAGRQGGGTSLDNSVRFGPEPQGEWMLVDIEPHLISGGYVHGSARLWSAGGTLLGVASQTATLLLFD
jgi:acyl-CoA thioesterase